MEQPLVTVICACYNQSAYILESLESVKNQTYPNLELVIWDDASKDNSVDIIDSWINQNPELKISFTKNSENKGICKSLNEAKSLAKGKYIQILALDDLLLPDKIERHVQLLEKSKSTDALVFSDAYLIDSASNTYQNRFIAYYKRYLSLESGNFFEELLKNNFIPAMTVLYKTEILNEIGSWDETLAYEDYDMLLRIAEKYDFIFDPIVSAKYRLHQKNTHETMFIEMERSKFNIYLKYANYNSTVKHKLLRFIESQYIDNNLKGENDRYFAVFPPQTFMQRWISKNKSPEIYRFLLKIQKIKNIIKYS